MKHLIPVVLALMAIIAGTAATSLLRGHAIVAICLYASCGVLTILAIGFSIYESLPQPHIVVTGYGRLAGGQIDGLLIENDGEPAYNLLPPDPVQLGSAKVTFEDPAITRLTKDDGKRCFPVWVETSLGSSSAGALFNQMVLNEIPEFVVKFRYADGKSPMCRRYTTVGMIERNVTVHGGLSGIFVKQKIRWLSLRQP